MTSTATNTANASQQTLALSIHQACLELGDGDTLVRALDHVDLDVAPGEFVAIVGPSGSGKSSLLAAAGALAAPDSGEINIQGTRPYELSQAKRAAFRLNHIGFVFQTGNLIPALNAAEQLELINRLNGGPRDFDPLELLRAVGMEHKAKNRPGQLSGGERQRVGIARALVSRPGLLLVDEPTAALDRARSQEVVQLLAQQCQEFGVATVMVTHDHDVLGHCDRVMEMVDGKLSAAN